MNYTITNGDNEIVKNITSPKPEWAQLQVAVGETLHEGRYTKDEYDYIGSGIFNRKTQAEYTPLISGDLRVLVGKLIAEMKRAGHKVPLHQELVLNKQHAKDLVDQASSSTLETYVSQGKFTPLEYQLTEVEIAEWRAAGSPANAIPEMLQSWLDNSQFTTAEEAAVDIEQTAVGFKNTIRSTRRLRLEGKKAIEDSTGDYITIMDNYIGQLKDLELTPTDPPTNDPVDPGGPTE